VSTIETIPTEALGAPGETCTACGAPLVPDQRYCLECGERRGAARVPFAEAWRISGEATSAHGAPPPPRPPAAAPAHGPERSSNAALLAGVGCLLLALLIGVLIGRAGDDNGGGSPQVVSVAGAGAPAGASASTAAFKDDWPEGKKGFTVELQALPKDSSNAAAVAAAKTAAAGKGATAVGALDSDSHASLDGGQYVVYSGLFASKAEASKALAKLKGDFPDANVVEVSDSGGATGASDSGSTSAPSASDTKSKKDLEGLDNSSPEDYQKKSAKLPKKVATPGKPPPKDNKPAGGGSDSESFE